MTMAAATRSAIAVRLLRTPIRPSWDFLVELNQVIKHGEIHVLHEIFQVHHAEASIFGLDDEFSYLAMNCEPATLQLQQRGGNTPTKKLGS
jgi:hypothetical protein